MKSLKKFDFPTTRTGGGTSQYDWVKLLDGSIYQLEAGKDFTANVKTVGMLARKQAKKRGKKVKLATPAAEEGQPILLILQAYDATPEEIAAWAAAATTETETEGGEPAAE